MDEIEELCNLTLNGNEINYLRSLELFKEDYLEYLKTFKLNLGNIFLSSVPLTNKLSFRIIGNWAETILFENKKLKINPKFKKAVSSCWIAGGLCGVSKSEHVDFVALMAFCANGVIAAICYG
jgi:hypothetical protein